MPKNLDQITAAAAEDVEITRMRVTEEDPAKSTFLQIQFSDRDRG